MKLSNLALILAAVLFVLSTVPKLQRPWMVAIGLALLACSMMPYFNARLD
jgi:hypothetical protein